MTVGIKNTAIIDGKQVNITTSGAKIGVASSFETGSMLQLYRGAGNPPSAGTTTTTTALAIGNSVEVCMIMGGYGSSPYALWLQGTDFTNFNSIRPIVINPRGGSVGINTSSPNTSSILDLTSTTKAFLPPRMTSIEKAAIGSPIAGMVVYDSTLNKLCVYTGAAWETITSV